MKAILIISVFCLAVTFNVSGQTTPQEMLNKAIYEEEVNGNLEEAIKLFLEIVDKNSANRTVTAEAFYHLGLSNEKLGNKKAKEYYQKVVNNFTDQPKFVRIAKERLSKLVVAEKVSKIPLTPKFTKINIPTKLSWYVKLSPDGKDLAVVSDKKLWKLPLSGNLGPGFSGTPVQLNTEGIEVDHQAGLSWSDDGKWIAFNEFPLNDTLVQKKGFQSIYVVPAKGGKPTKIIENFRSGRIENFGISISPDGKNLAHTSFNENGQYVYTTAVAGGSQKQLVDIQAREPAFSSDGKWIAYVEDKNFGTGGGNLWIVPAIGGEPKLIAKAGYATSPVWSPENSMIAFVDDDKKNQINVVEIPKEGKGIGNVISIAAPEGTEKVSLLAGWSTDNKIAAMITKKVENAIYSLPVQGGVATEILHDCWAMMPRWSPDGSHIYYATTEDKGSQRAFQLTLASVPANGGTGKLFAKDNEGKKVWQLGNQGGNRISTDGKTIVSAAWEEFIPELNFPLVNIWKITTDGIKSEKITNKKGHYADFSPSWSPDGNKIAFIRAKLKRTTSSLLDTVNITTINSSGSEEKILATVSDKFIFSLVWSPDGKMLAFLSKENEAPYTNLMNFINAHNGELLYEWEVPYSDTDIELAWAPDSRRIAFNDREGEVIKIMNIENGNIEDIKTNLGDVKIGHIDWSPDGENFVFAGSKGGGAEFWFMEDFLPLEKLAQNNETEAAKEPEGIKIKQIWTGPKVDNSGTVSLNGEYLSFVDGETGGIAIRNLKTNKNTSLIEGSYDSPLRYAQYNCISPDGKQIAYNWVTGNSSGLYLIDLERSSPSLLYKQEGETVNPVTWISEKELIVIVWKSKNKDQVCLFNILDRTMQVLKTSEQAILRQLFSSPDGKYIAYGFENETHNGNVDINIHPMDGKAEISLIKHPANDIGLGWVPGTKEFLFISDRSGTWDLWAIAIDNGKPSRPSKRIYADLGEVQPMGFTENGDCYFGLSRGSVNTYIAPFNAANGDINVKSGKIILGSNLWMSWSPDGNYLTYIKAGEKNSNGWQLTIQEIKTGLEHKLANNLGIAWSPWWSPDGNSILVVGLDKNKEQTEGYEGGIYTVDVKTGKTTEILLLSNYKYNNPTGDALPLRNIRWSSDGNSIFMLFFQDRLVKYDLETGNVETLYKQSHFDRNVLNLSPDGKRLLFAAKSPEQKKSHLYTMPVGGGKEKELCSPQESDNFRFAAWSPDGLFIYFIERIEGTNLWRIPAEGGIPQLVWQSDDRIEGFDFHPDGKQIIYAIHEQTTEIRVIEGLVKEVEKIFSLKE